MVQNREQLDIYTSKNKIFRAFQVTRIYSLNPNIFSLAEGCLVPAVLQESDKESSAMRDLRLLQRYC
jgi:hypothetical protein